MWTRSLRPHQAHACTCPRGLTHTHSTHALTDPHGHLACTGGSRNMGIRPCTHTTQRPTRPRCHTHVRMHIDTHPRTPAARGHLETHETVSAEPYRYTNAGAGPQHTTASAYKYTCPHDRYTHPNTHVRKPTHANPQSQSHCPWFQGPPLSLGTVSPEVAGLGLGSVHLKERPRVGSGGSGMED